MHYYHCHLATAHLQLNILLSSSSSSSSPPYPGDRIWHSTNISSTRKVRIKAISTKKGNMDVVEININVRMIMWSP
jgi:hypothetical protein